MKFMEYLSDKWFDFTRPFRNTYHFVIKLFQYAKVLWSDRDFDYAHILILLQYKLKRTREHIVEHDMVESAQKTGKQIKHAELLIQRILEDDYCKELQIAHDTKWGEVIQYFDPKKDGERYYRYHVIRANATTPELEEQERQEQMAVYDAQHQAREKDLDRLFRHIRKYLQGWWD
jgi:hypothetical protein